MTPGQFGPIRIDFESLERALDLHHVEHRDALGDADDQLHLGVDRLEDRVRREGRRHVDHRCIGAGRGARLMHRVEDRQVQVGAAPLARRDAADHLGAIGDRLFGVEGALRAGEALADDLGVFVDENGHDGSLVFSPSDDAGAIVGCSLARLRPVPDQMRGFAGDTSCRAERASASELDRASALR